MSTSTNNSNVDYFKTIIKYDNENVVTKFYFLLWCEKFLSLVACTLKFGNKFPVRWKTADFLIPYFDFKDFFIFGSKYRTMWQNLHSKIMKFVIQENCKCPLNICVFILLSSVTERLTSFKLLLSSCL